MIVDHIQNIERYHGLSRGIDALIDWLASNDWRTLEVGRTEIDGNRVFANVMDATTRLADNAHYETHARYMDLQVDICGREAFQVAQGAVNEITPFSEEQDFGLCDAADEAVVFGCLGNGRFALFMAGEPHMPTLEFPGDGQRDVKKICFKILVDEFWAEG